MPKKIKLLFSGTLLASFLLFAGFGCQGLSQQQQVASQPITLEYWTVFDDVDALQAQVDQYKVVHPYITVNIRQLRADEIYQRLVEALAEDKGPDIISVRNRWMVKLKSKLAAMPPSVQDTLVTVTKGVIGENTAVTSQVRPTITVDQLGAEYVRAVKNDVVIDDSIYGLPLSFDDMALYYNKDLLDRVGVAEPPKNWEELQAAVKKLTKYDKTGKITQSGVALGTGSNISGSDDLLYLLFKQSGLDFVDQTGHAAFNAVPQNLSSSETPATSVLNFYTDFANSTRDTYTWNENMGSALDSFVNGSLGFFFGYNYHYPVIKARAPQLNFGVLPMPQLNPENPTNAANYWVQTVVGKSKHQNEAWGLVTFLTHSPATKDYLDKTDRPTAIRAYIVGQSQKPELAPFVSQELVADNWYRGNDYEAAAAALNDMIHEWLQPVPDSTDSNKVAKWRQDILNRAAEKINQTL